MFTIADVCCWEAERNDVSAALCPRCSHHNKQQMLMRSLACLAPISQKLRCSDVMQPQQLQSPCRGSKARLSVALAAFWDNASRSILGTRQARRFRVGLQHRCLARKFHAWHAWAARRAQLQRLLKAARVACRRIVLTAGGALLAVLQKDAHGS